MIAREYIDKNLLPLSNDVLVKDVIHYFINHKLNETFIFTDDQRLNLLKLSDIISQEGSEPAGNYSTLFEFRVNKNLHWSQLLPFYKTLGIDILPAFNENNSFIGLISKNYLVSNVIDFITMEEPGAILILQCDPVFYAASEVIRIAEMNNTRVVALFTHFDMDAQKLKITLKINLQSTRDIAGTYERFGYEVSEVFMNKDFDNDIYSDRYESLMRIFDLK